MGISAAKMERGSFIVGNWKMELGQRASRGLAQEIGRGIVERGLNQQSRVRFGVAPSPMCLEGVNVALDGFHSNILVGGQSFYAQESKGSFVHRGAFTGETSLPQLLEAGAKFTILGHSETRDIEEYGVRGLGVTDIMLNHRLRGALEHLNSKGVEGFSIIYCVGETLAQKKAGDTRKVIKDQIYNGLTGLTDQDFARVVIAYEPVWAIGTGESATAEEANEVAAFIREIIRVRVSADVALKLMLQYGGSVKEENATQLMSQPDIDGALIGGAALEAPKFLSILSKTAEVYSG